ncbi:hypothetical protein GF342_01340 [Candidatus Woesearchaeota archaeon]|nr:hypothetical protein [Candidatus Woesearchaeota archaeon]
MTLYAWQHPQDDRTRFYSRQREDIIEVLDHYVKQTPPEDHERSDLAPWVREPATLDDIKEVKRGVLLYAGAFIRMGKGDEPLFMNLDVLPDFTVQCIPEHLGQFDYFRQGFGEHKRGPLYKVFIPQTLFGGLYFLPQDICKAIREYNLTEELRRVESQIREREEIIQGQPYHLK